MEPSRQHAIAYAVSALMLAVGVSVGGYFVGNMLYKSRIATNLATVKGLAEREVKADIGTWNVSFSASAPDLKSAYAAANESKDTVATFLKNAGFTDAEITKEAFSVNREEHRGENNKLLDTTYSIFGAVRVRSEQVDKIAEAAQQVGDLVGQGVLLTNTSPQYSFTKLNEIKPDMLGEATRNARIAAEQFAKDANAKVGNINAAEQGAFNFSARDAGEYDGGEQASIYKKVRVVTTISFYLEN